MKKPSRRMRRMARHHKKRMPGLSLTSLMDVFTILVFFLLVNQSSSEVMEPPKQITLPDSVVQAKPRETVVIVVSSDAVVVQGEPVMATADVLSDTSDTLEPITGRLGDLKESVIGISTKVVAESREVTILSDKAIPFKVLKKIMTSCTMAGYEKISLAVIEKASQYQNLAASES